MKVKEYEGQLGDRTYLLEVRLFGEYDIARPLSLSLWDDQTETWEKVDPLAHCAGFWECWEAVPEPRDPEW